MLLKTGQELDLVHDSDVLEMLERMKRGGLCFVGSKRHAKANNKYLADYDKTNPSTFIMYWDANNQYGKAMSDPLPYGGFHLRKDIASLEDELHKLSNMSDDAEREATMKWTWYSQSIFITSSKSTQLLLRPAPLS